MTSICQPGLAFAYDAKLVLKQMSIQTQKTTKQKPKNETKLTAGVLKQDPNIQKVQKNADFKYNNTKHGHIWGGKPPFPSNGLTGKWW